MKYIILKNNTVNSIVVADELFAAQQKWIPWEEGVSIGWIYNGDEFVPPSRDIDSEWEKARSVRDVLLFESDVYVTVDRWSTYTVEKQKEWALYRQLLRDIPQKFSDPNDIEWPVKP